MRLPNSIAVLMASILLAGCVTLYSPPTFYEPPPSAGAATIVAEDNLNPARMFLIGGHSIYPLVVDGHVIRDAGNRGADPLPLRPGPRRVLISKSTNGSSGVVLAEFDAQAGETYFVRHRVEKSEGLAGILDPGKWFVWIEDKSGKAITEPSLVPVYRRDSPPHIPIVVPKGKR